MEVSGINTHTNIQSLNRVQIFATPRIIVSIHGILQARILEWVTIPSPGDFPDPGIKPGSPALQADLLALCHLGSLMLMVGDNSAGGRFSTIAVCFYTKMVVSCQFLKIRSELQYSKGGDKCCQNLLWSFCLLSYWAAALLLVPYKIHQAIEISEASFPVDSGTKTDSCSRISVSLHLGLSF